MLINIPVLPTQNAFFAPARWIDDAKLPLGISKVYIKGQGPFLVPHDTDHFNAVTEDEIYLLLFIIIVVVLVRYIHNRNLMRTSLSCISIVTHLYRDGSKNVHLDLGNILENPWLVQGSWEWFN